MTAADKAYVRAHPEVGRVYAAPSDVRLDDENVSEPDVYFVGKEWSGTLTDHGAGGAPDLVAEVLSPSTLRLDREKKRAVYFQAGMRELWLVPPDRRRVEVHLPDGPEAEPARTMQGADLLQTPVLPGWSLAVDELFD